MRPGWRLRAGPRGSLLAVMSGLALGATFSPYGGPILPFLAFAPLGAALERLGGDEWGDGRGRLAVVFAPGFVAAAVAHAIGLYWMVPALWWRTPLAVPLYVLMVALLGLLGGIACTAATALRRRRWPVPVALACCWTGFEWAAAHVPGISYAWLNAGGSLAWYPAVAAGAEVLGARFLTFWTVAVGGLAGVVVGRARLARRGVRVRPVLLLLGLVALPLAAGILRQRAFERLEVVATAAAVQAGRADTAAARGELWQWHAPLRDLAAEGPFDVAIFPERFLAAPLRDADGGRSTDAGREVADFAAALGSPVLIGALDADVGENDRDTLWYNAAFVQTPGELLSEAYRKIRPVPGVEGIGWFPGTVFGLANRGYAPGRSPRPLSLGGGAVGAMVCYDSAYGETARALVRGGADWLAVISNDDWLDPQRPFRTTWAYWQHATHGRLRALENRISLVQVAATGHTFAVSAGGRGAEFVLGAGEEGVATLAVGRRGAVTLFTGIGDVLGLGCFLIFALVAGVTAIAPRAHRPVQGRGPIGFVGSPQGPPGDAQICVLVTSKCPFSSGSQPAGRCYLEGWCLASSGRAPPLQHPSPATPEECRHRSPPRSPCHRDRGALPDRGAPAL